MRFLPSNRLTTESFIENRELVQEAQELYEFIKFVATSTDKVGRAALLFIPQKEYHPIVLSTVRELIKNNKVIQ